MTQDVGTHRPLPLFAWFIPPVVGPALAIVLLWPSMCSIEASLLLFQILGTLVIAYGPFIAGTWRTGSVAAMQFATASASLLTIPAGMLFMVVLGDGASPDAVWASAAVGTAGLAVGFVFGCFGVLAKRPYNHLFSKEFRAALVFSAMVPAGIYCFCVLAHVGSLHTCLSIVARSSGF